MDLPEHRYTSLMHRFYAKRKGLNNEIERLSKIINDPNLRSDKINEKVMEHIREIVDLKADFIHLLRIIEEKNTER